MKIYLVAVVDYDQFTIKGIHQTKEGAIQEWESAKKELIEDYRQMRECTDSGEWWEKELMNKMQNLEKLSLDESETFSGRRPIIEEHDLKFP